MELLLIGLAVYFVPTVIAYVRRHRNTGAIAALNVLLGWTVLGWVIAFVWSLMHGEAAVPITAAASPSERKCPWCAEVIKADARICRFCGRELPPLPPEMR
jgi:hypothetical protein